MATVKRKSTVPYYACAGVWVLYAALFPLYRPAHFLIVAAVSALVFGALRLFCPDVEEQIVEKPKEEEPTGNEALDAMIRDGGAALAEMRQLNAAISNPRISADIDRLEEVSGKIFAQVRAEPERLPQIRRFLDYYLPTTLKLLRAYERMASQGVSGENIDGTMSRVEGMMGTVVTAFEKQLDALFGAEAMDVSTDITVLESLMRREGLVSDELHDAVTDAASDAPASGAATARLPELKLEP